MRYLVMILILLAGTANAEVWVCQSASSWQKNGEIALIAATDVGDGFGSIQMEGITYVAQYEDYTQFEAGGFVHRWEFDMVERISLIPSYSFTIDADGKGLLFDYSNVQHRPGAPTSTVHLFTCKNSKSYFKEVNGPE